MKTFDNFLTQSSVDGVTFIGPPPLSVLFAQELLKKDNNPIIILVNNNETIKTLENDLTTFNSFYKNNASVYTLLDWHKCPYKSHVHPSSLFLKNRLKTLINITNESKPFFLIAHCEAIFLNTISQKQLNKFSVLLTTKSVISPILLAQKLKHIGFEQHALVTDPGTFALRGDILDVFPINLDNPIRIDFFDDQIESLRIFDIHSQRTLENLASLSQLHLFQAREDLLNKETLPFFKSSFKKFFDHNGFSKKIRDDILENIKMGFYPETSPYWLSFIYEHTQTAFDYLPENSSIIFYECSKIKNSLLLSKEYSPDLNFPLPEPKKMYALTEEVLLLKNKKIYWEPLLQENKNQFSFNTQPISDSTQPIIEVIKKMIEHKKLFFYIFCETESEKEKINFLLDGIPLLKSHYSIFVSPLSESFYWLEEEKVFLNSESFFKKKKYHHRSHLKNKPTTLQQLITLNDLLIGNTVVHLIHGIGVYAGLKRLSLNGAPTDFLCLEYQGGDKLYLPVDKMNLIQKHSDSEKGIKLNKLGSQSFEQTKNNVRTAVKKVAFSLIQLYAKRSVLQGPKIDFYKHSFDEFESTFPFEETIDQKKSIEDILSDFKSGKVVDRVICGDVGFGKTEVAMRAAFLAVNAGYQVAVLVPTTILCLQHEKTFTERFQDTGINIQSISRLKSKQIQIDILNKIKTGGIDILIGTHRILSKDIRFKNLGLLIIDEEHRFGVEHKEKLKNIKENTHTLTLTATPIPRTLQMALTGIRDLSIIQTPPQERLPIQTFVSRYNNNTIQEAIDSELSRNGQVIFLHNKVKNIFQVAHSIKELVPYAKIDVAHGQLSAHLLEKKILSFFNKEINVLVCTTIIESGIDIPSANTLIVNRADTLGLSQLYQIRGRVGRGDKRAYAYLLIPEHGKLSDEAQYRLNIIQKFVDLGSGFKISAHDLDLRGGGNILGAEQSGHIHSVGIELYLDLLKEAIDEIKGNSINLNKNLVDPEIKVPYPCFIDEKYISDLQLRLRFYKKLSISEGESDVDQIEKELQDRFGKIPTETLNLLWIIRIKIILRLNKIKSLICSHTTFSIEPDPSCQLLTPEKVIQVLKTNPDVYQITSDSRFKAHAPNESVKKIYTELEKHINILKEL